MTGMTRAGMTRAGMTRNSLTAAPVGRPARWLAGWLIVAASCGGCTSPGHPLPQASPSASAPPGAAKPAATPRPPAPGPSVTAAVGLGALPSVLSFSPLLPTDLAGWHAGNVATDAGSAAPRATWFTLTYDDAAGGPVAQLYESSQDSPSVHFPGRSVQIKPGVVGVRTTGKGPVFLWWTQGGWYFSLQTGGLTAGVQLDTVSIDRLRQIAASITVPPACHAGQLELGLGPRVSPQTGEHGVIFLLTNRSERPCHLFGYPGVSLYGQTGAPVPFAFQRGGQYVAGIFPDSAVPVLLRPGGQAEFLVAKYRCDAGILGYAPDVRVYPPNDTAQLDLRLSGISTYDYCRPVEGPASGDPGNTVEVSPVVPPFDASGG